MMRAALHWIGMLGMVYDGMCTDSGGGKPTWGVAGNGSVFGYITPLI
jgi:hypothetical protein